MLCEIIPEKCIACGLCQVLAPTIFDYTDQGIVLFKEQQMEVSMIIPKEQEAACLVAYKKCPTRAIVVPK